MTDYLLSQTIDWTDYRDWIDWIEIVLVSEDSTAAWLKRLQTQDPDQYRKVFRGFREATKGHRNGGRGQHLKTAMPQLGLASNQPLNHIPERRSSQHTRFAYNL